MTILRNIEACEELTKITRTSLGPNGMNKMVINHIDKLYVTSDAATILAQMEINHPAAKTLVLAAQMQEQEIGDGSNFVIVLAGELLHKAGELLQMGLHPNEIVQGYNIAQEQLTAIMNDIVVWSPDKKDLFNPQTLQNGLLAAVSSKTRGEETFLAPLIAEACKSVLPENTYNFTVDNIRTVKLPGGSLQQSEVVRGMVFMLTPLTNVDLVDNAQIAVFTCSIESAATETKGTVLLSNASELMNYNEGEEKFLHDQIKSIAESGVNVVVTSGSVGDLAKHFLDKYKIMCISIGSQWEIRRLCRATRARAIVALGPVAKEDQGFCKKVHVREFGLKKCVVFTQEEKDESNVASIILRSSTQNALEDLERAVDDGVNTVRQMGRDPRFLAGAGACDIEMARRLNAIAAKRSGLDQYAVKAYAEALEVVPRTLAENAGMDSMQIQAQLYAAHEKGDINVGIDIENLTVGDMTKSHIYDLLSLKANAIRLATNAVVTILRVDQIIMSKPAGGPKAPQNQGHWDDNDL